MKIQTATLINAGFDVNGNAKRAYIVNEIDTDSPMKVEHIVDVIEQHYNTTGAVTEFYPNCYFNGYQINVSKKEYRDFIKIGKAKREGKAAQ